MLIKNAKVFMTQGGFEQKDINIIKDRFVEMGSNIEEVIDASELYAIPGLVDVHLHGCAGKDFCEGTKEAIQTILNYQLSQGITSVCPATMTVPKEEILQICKTAGEFQSEEGARLVGINLEGPFIAAAKKGAQKADNILLPDVDLYREWQKASNQLCKLIDIAPEVEGAMDFIEAVKDEIHVSVAHTTADYDVAREAFEKGADHITHLYNAMAPFTHRAPGVVGAGAENEKVFAEIICDGIHIHPATIRATMKMYGNNRMVFISDSMEATGLEDGTYALGGQPVIVKGNLATLEDGTIAGSATNLMGCLRYAIQGAELSLWDAVACATINPAKSIGMFQEIGSIDEGKKADLLLINEKLEIIHIIKDGKIVK